VVGLSTVMQFQSSEADRNLLKVILKAMQTDRDFQVREACIDALMCNSDKVGDVIPQLEQASHDPVDSVHQKALQALCHLYPDHAQCRWAMDEALKQKEYATVAAGLQAVERLGDEGVSYAPIVCRLLADSNFSNATAAANALKRMGSKVAPTAVPALISALRTQQWPAKRSVIAALKAMGPEAKQAVPELERIANSEDTNDRPVQSEAKRALEELRR
jgi:HEAT repeat protein